MADRGASHDVFPAFLIPVLTQLLFPKPLSTFLTCIRDERQKIDGKKESNQQPHGHESDTLCIEQAGEMQRNDPPLQYDPFHYVEK